MNMLYFYNKKCYFLMQAFVSDFIVKWYVQPEESGQQFMKEVVTTPTCSPLKTVKNKPY